MPVTRFAPSPTGLLHIGHALSALFARAQAGPAGRMLLRIEDIDRTRCRPEFVAAFQRLSGTHSVGLRELAATISDKSLVPMFHSTIDAFAGAGLLFKETD